MNLAILGLGRWGKTLVESIQGKSNLVRFTRAATRTPSKVKEFCNEYNIELSDNYESILSDKNVAGVVITTPHSQHEKQIVLAANAGKHIFCDKPVTLTRKSAENAFASVRKANVIFAAGHNRRFLPAMQNLKEMISSGKLGKILHIEGNMSGHVGARYTNDMWRVDPIESPAGGLAGSGIHIIDAMIHLVGQITEVQAQSFKLVHKIDLDDTTSMLFRFSSGASGYLVALTATAPIFRLQVFGDKGHAELRGEQNLEFVSVEGEKISHSFPYISSEKIQLETFAETILNNSTFPISIDEVISGVAAFEAVSISIKKNQKIIV